MQNIPLEMPIPSPRHAMCHEDDIFVQEDWWLGNRHCLWERQAVQLDQKQALRNDGEHVLAALPSGRKLRDGRGALAGLLRRSELRPLYQCIAFLNGGKIFGHEALIRGPVDKPLHMPDALLRAAAAEGLTYEFESLAAAREIEGWGALREPGRLFVNVSATVLVQLVQACGVAALRHRVMAMGVLPRMVVLEITEHERVSDMERLAAVVEEVRDMGMSLALDDFGDGRSSLRLWSQLKPEFVKIDKYFTKDISRHADKLKTIQALQQIGAIFNTSLIAEGIETLEDLRVLRDLGIPYGQGYLLGMPMDKPVAAIDPKSEVVLKDRRVSVFPDSAASAQLADLRAISVIDAPTVDTRTTNDTLAKLLIGTPHLHAVAVLDDARPVAIINRSQFMNEYSRLYYREVWGRKSCMQHANHEPRLIERNHRIDELVGILTSDDQRYLADGFIVTENGRYVGLGTADQLVRSVTETRIEAARHANPLTFLPGNVPISQHLDRLLKSGADFVACYADLNHFKPFNDQYGYWRGDDMIRLLARIIKSSCDPQCDFVGHVGGDDFVVVFQSPDWRTRCERIIEELRNEARLLFDSQAQEIGGIQAEDRHGVERFFPCTTLSIGAVMVRPGMFRKAEEVASFAAAAKHRAKSSDSGFYLLSAESPSAWGRIE